MITLHDWPRQAAALQTECTRLAQDVARLQRLLADATLMRNTHNAARQQRLWFDVEPNRLAGLIDLQARTDAETRRLIPSSYQQFLERLHPATTLQRPPRQLNFASLAPAARPYLLGPFLNLSFGAAYPRLCLTRSAPEHGRLVYIAVNGPSEAALWRQHLPAISEWLGGNWELAHHEVSTIVLERRVPLPTVFPWNPAALARNQLYLGVDVAERTPVYLPFAELSAGTFVPGATGTGKSNALQCLLQSIFANLHLFAAVYLVDGKDGITMQRYASIAPNKVHVLWEERHLWQLTEDLVGFMRARTQQQRDHQIEKATDGFIAVVIDEMATFTARPSLDPKHPDNKRHTKFMDDLAQLARRGRSAGLRLFIAAQEPVAEQIPPTIRANCLTTIAFKLPIDVHATAVFGQLDGLPADPRHLPRGRALLKNGMTGDLCCVQFPVIGARR